MPGTTTTTQRETLGPIREGEGKRKRGSVCESKDGWMERAGFIAKESEREKGKGGGRMSSKGSLLEREWRGGGQEWSRE